MKFSTAWTHFELVEKAKKWPRNDERQKIFIPTLLHGILVDYTMQKLTSEPLAAKNLVDDESWLGTRFFDLQRPKILQWS